MGPLVWLLMSVFHVRMKAGQVCRALNWNVLSAVLGFVNGKHLTRVLFIDQYM